MDKQGHVVHKAICEAFKDVPNAIGAANRLPPEVLLALSKKGYQTCDSFRYATRQGLREAGIEPGHTDTILGLQAVQVAHEREMAGPGPSSTGAGEYAQYLLNLPAPSKLQPTNLLLPDGSAMLQNWRLPGPQCGIPPQLQHPAFGVFLDWLHKCKPNQDDMEAAACLCGVAASYYSKEEELRQLLVPKLRDYLSVGDQHDTLPQFSVRAEDKSHLKPDWCVVDNVNRPTGLLVILEFKNGLTGGDPSLQGFGYYSKFWASRLVDTTGKYSDLHNAFRRTCCPALLIEVLGPLLRVSSLAWLGRIVLYPMTPLLNMLWLEDDPQVLQLACALRGVKESLRCLRDCYSGLRPPAAPLQARLSGLEAGLPYPLRERYVDVEQVQAGTLLYKATRANGVQVAVKLSRHYCVEAHQKWAGLKLAPALYEAEQLPGGYQLLEMELLGEGWQSLDALARVDVAAGNSAMAAALQALQRAHAHAHDDSGRPFVHGDARPTNIMVRRAPRGGGAPGSGGVEAGSGGVETGSGGVEAGSGGVEAGSGGVSFDICFVDFDFSGLEGVGTYPSPLNPVVPWAPDAGFGLPLHRSHDEFQLQQRASPGAGAK
ncbi:hypothetical protein HYH03_014541 [Edaphochlamys debaryana]|uniref:Protein kinase domain-containing protein n=1 Tax=Edaphochlamys debaryana TaxID=47281 RepID=A0A835XML6_9CHLO|nr:hypothetical protein HYH03_014541 [Edaphochlamys debaryana]|eukprot:KAG2486858.1 hypothetical protein HYH03_014541 [Edaphochlamys debaryana]